MIYLVCNMENPDEPFVVNVCSTYKKAKEIADQCEKNFMTQWNELVPFQIVELSLDNNKEVLWDCYGSDGKVIETN